MSNYASRPYHAFLSYSHKDREIAVRICHWLVRDAGFRIWFDESHLKAGSSVASRLSEEMSACRNWIFIASEHAGESTWISAERDQALHCKTETKEFNLIILRIDNCEVPKTWPSLARFNWLDAPGGVISINLAKEIIDRLDGRIWSGRQNNLRDIYISRGWRQNDRPFADLICQNLCKKALRLRLVGDVQDQESFIDERIREIISSCSGHLAILPRRMSGERPTENDYKYIIRELTISKESGLPALIVTDKDTYLPDSLNAIAVRVDSLNELRQSWDDEMPEWLNQFIDDLIAPPSPKHIFLAAEFKRNTERISHLREFIEYVTGLPCKIGRDFEGTGIREQIVANIVTAKVFLANLTSFGDVDDL
jgi:hypothetical protein